MVQNKSPTPHLDSLESSINNNPLFNIYSDVDYMAMMLFEITRIMRKVETGDGDFSDVSQCLGDIIDRASLLKELVDKRSG